MSATIHVKPWPDPVIDVLGHDPRSWYVETFWLPTLGPTCVLLMRHLADRFDRRPDGLTLPVADTAQALGLGSGVGSSSPLQRSLSRLVQFDLACDGGDSTVAVRRHLPPVNRRHVRRLPPMLQAEHADWVQSQLDVPALDIARRRARRVAFTLLEQGDEPDHVERALHSVGFHPSVCREAASWAVQRHREALEAATATDPAA
ncbi:MAG: hypothetical protein M5T61_03990 [Acidimicrobiia bacterium]|nr:hypothetical protein [Acidimicrobiia bacterium]